jgi:hypothetical protein
VGLGGAAEDLIEAEGMLREEMAREGLRSGLVFIFHSIRVLKSE